MTANGKNNGGTVRALRLLGGHISVAGGLYKAPARAAALGFRAMQIFVKNQRQWVAPPLDDAAIRAFRGAQEESGVVAVLAHSSYLVNLATPKEDLRKKSEDALVGEMARCAKLGIPSLVLHPGSHSGAGETSGLETVTRSLDTCLERAGDCGVRILLETTAGQGTALGYRLEHLAAILERSRHPDRLAVCVDTCHVFVAGYDIARAEGWAAFWEAFDRLLGASSLAAVHVNGAKKPLGSRVDRHALLDQGYLGDFPFRELLEDTRFATVPLVFETPGGEAHYAEQARWLDTLMAKAASPGPVS